MTKIRRTSSARVVVVAAVTALLAQAVPDDVAVFSSCEILLDFPKHEKSVIASLWVVILACCRSFVCLVVACAVRYFGGCSYR